METVQQQQCARDLPRQDTDVQDEVHKVQKKRIIIPNENTRTGTDPAAITERLRGRSRSRRPPTSMSNAAELAVPASRCVTPPKLRARDRVPGV